MKLKKLKKIWQKYWHWLVVLFLASAFFVGTASYNHYIQADNFIKFSSPDATANYTFAKLYGQTGELELFEKYNLYVDDIIHPRSMRSDNGEVKPVSFLGIMIIYGTIIKFTSYEILPYLTPLFGAIGIVFFYLLTGKLFGRRNALISTFLLSCFPVFIYYSARSMFHNVLFVVLLIIGLYFSVLMVKRRKGYKNYLFILNAALGGFFVGLAIITRTSELIWLAPVLFILWIINMRKIGISRLLIFIAFIFLAILPVLYNNQILYSSPIFGGYPEMNQAMVNISKASGDLVKSTLIGELAYHKELVKNIFNNIFHFGINTKQSVKMFYYYFFDMFTWLFIMSALGLILFLQKIYKWKKRHFSYFLSLVITSAILVFYYGSWKFNDNPDPNSFTIGNSYTRYWLPIYLGLIPMASYFLIKFSQAIFPDRKKKRDTEEIGEGDNVFYKLGALKALPYLTKKKFGKPRKNILVTGFRILVVASICAYSILFVLFGSEEGLYLSAIKQKATQVEWQGVMDLTESNSVIITKYHDKLFFPERKVVYGLFDDDEMNARYSKLEKYLPVYYYNFTFPEKDFNYLNENKLKKAGLQIEVVKQVNGDFSLYRIISE